MWKDITSFSQGAKDLRPRIFEAKIGDLRLVIVWGHIDYPNEWSMHLILLRDNIGLGLKKYEDLEKAKAKAVAFAEKVLKTALDDVKLLKGK
jgi:hypothetical protein